MSITFSRVEKFLFIAFFIWVAVYFMFGGEDLIFKQLFTHSQVNIGTYKTKYFTPDSVKLLDQMKEGGLSEQSLMEFAMLEDEFMGFEKQTVCHHISYLREAMTLDQQMKDRFPGWDFNYHQLHIRQMSQPSKLINKNLSCS
jgi:hypothetical protein